MPYKREYVGATPAPSISLNQRNDMDLNKIRKCLTSLEDFAFILGDGGAPVTQEEIEIMAEELPKIIDILKKETDVTTATDMYVKYSGFCDD